MAKKLVIVLVLLVLGITLGFWLHREVAIDACLDAGGRWDGATISCDRC